MWGRSIFKWILLVLGVLGVAAATGDLILVSAHYWYVAVPVLLACGALAYWSLGPSPAEKAVPPQLDDDGQPVWKPLNPLQEVLLRLGMTLAVLAGGVVGLGGLFFLGALALDHLEISIPFFAVAAVLGVMAIWPSRKAKANPPVVTGERGSSDDIVT